MPCPTSGANGPALVGCDCSKVHMATVAAWAWAANAKPSTAQTTPAARDDAAMSDSFKNDEFRLGRRPWPGAGFEMNRFPAVGNFKRPRGAVATKIPAVLGDWTGGLRIHRAGGNALGDVFDHVPDGLKLLGVGVGDGELKFVLDGHGEFDRVQRIEVQIVDEVRGRGDFAGRDSGLFGGQFDHLCLDLFMAHGGMI